MQLVGRVQSRRSLPQPAERRAIREAAGVSLEEVAVVVGVSRQAVALWEIGSRFPRGANLDAYVEVLQALREATAA